MNGCVRDHTGYFLSRAAPPAERFGPETFPLELLTYGDESHGASEAQQEQAHGEQLLRVQGPGQAVEHPELPDRVQERRLRVQARARRTCSRVSVERLGLLLLLLLRFVRECFHAPTHVKTHAHAHTGTIQAAPSVDPAWEYEGKNLAQKVAARASACQAAARVLPG